MSFYVAATSPDDFDHMWFKINKLLTMVYPQYTAGRELSGNNYNFKAPFSQLMGASPLVRIRLGDLIRSNYSRFALARLFGMADNTAKLITADGKEKEIKFPDSGTVNVPNSSKKLNEWKNNLPAGTKVTLKDSAIDSLVDFINNDTSLSDLSKIKNDIVRSAKQFARKQNQVNVLNDSGIFLNTDKTSNKKYIVANTVKSTISDKKYINEDSYRVKVDIETTLGKSRSITLTLPASSIDATDEEYVQKSQEFASAAENEALAKKSDLSSIDVLQAFMNPVNNAVVKSFESAAGKGLAGFIDSMSFDWHDKVKWEIEPGSVAPKMCKVTIQFSPIHDISPGIDHHGYNRAPVYPAGRAMLSLPNKTSGNGGSTGGPTG
jgi:hypothetical protein